MAKLCEMCGGRRAEKYCFVEGVALWLCAKCSALGKEVTRPRVDAAAIAARRAAGMPPRAEVVSAIVPDFASRIRRARDKKGLTQGELAAKSNVKESFITRIENEKARPDIATAEKLEKALGITLVTQESSAAAGKAQQKTAPVLGGTLTMGDVLKIKTEESKKE